MHKIPFVVVFLLFSGQFISAQDRQIPADTSVVSERETVIRGENVPYRVTVGTQPVWNDEGKVVAALHYTYYERTDVEDRSERPLMISFNGGPGSASVWMHLGYTGPYFLNIDPEGYPVKPYGVVPNEHSVLDATDILFVNPVNTGYSRILDPEADREDFFGIEADIRYLAEWINTFVSRNERWTSPKFLIGESYGTTRVAGLALELQNRQWMYLNGVILVSPTHMGIDRDGPVGVANRVPYFAATAWYHGVLEQELQELDLYDVLEKAEGFAIEELLPALVRGGFMEEDKRLQMAESIARFSGLDVKTVLQYNLDVDYASFWKLLLQDRGYTVGRLDSRYLGIDRMEAGTRPDYWAELTSWLHSFTPAVNHYFREKLGFKTDVKYNMFGPVQPWDRSGDNTAENLRQAMAQNTFLNVLFQVGYYDGATTYFNAKYSMWQMDPSGKLRDRMRYEGYRSGHMMYLRHEDLDLSNQHLREFILESLPSKGEPARY